MLLPPTGLGAAGPIAGGEELLPGPAEPNSRSFVAEEQVDEPEAWTPEQICLCSARWKRYLEKVQVSALGGEGDETEQDRYRTVLEMLESEDARLGEEGSEVSLQREKWAMMQQNRRVRASLRPHLDELQAIANAAERVQTHETRLAQIKTDQEEWLEDISKNPGRLCSFKNVRIGGFYDVDSWEVRVVTGLSHSRYYLGHSGGDYVFEYCSPGNASGDEYCQGDEAWDPNGPVWKHPGLQGAFGLDQGGAETASFKFRGLVPRTWREYSTRFELVCKDVLQVLAAFISFEPEGDGPLWGAQYQHVPTFSEINIRILAHVRDSWRMGVSLNHPYLCWARSILDHHPRICEFAFLVTQLDGRLSRGLTRVAMAPLVETVESATEMTLEELHVIYQDILGKEALRELHESRNIEHCVLYDKEGQEIEVMSQLIHTHCEHREIHAFYAQPKFCLDPVHPNNRFNRPRVQEALDTAVNLCCRDWQWTDRTASGILFELRDQFCTPISTDSIATVAHQLVPLQPQELGSGQTDLAPGQDSHNDTSTIVVKTEPETAYTPPETRGTKRNATELQQQSSESASQEEKHESDDNRRPKRRRGRPRNPPRT